MPSTASADGTRRVEVPGGVVVVLGTIHGLVSEADRVRAAFRAVSPAVVALGLSSEATAALLRHAPGEGDDPFEDLSDHDEAYSLYLARYGDVSLPPPGLVEAARLAARGGLPVWGVDLPEEAYEEAYTGAVTVWQLLRYGRIQRRLARRPPRAATAEEFALAWDRALGRIKGLARVEALREDHMAMQAARLASGAPGPVLLVVDLPRAAGVAARLEALETG